MAVVVVGGVYQSFFVRLRCVMTDFFFVSPRFSLAELRVEPMLQIGSKFSQGWVGLVVEGLGCCARLSEGGGVDKEKQRLCGIEKMETSS